MRITIFGTGGIGGYLAGKLGAISDDPDTEVGAVSLIARGEHLKKIREQGLKFIDARGDSHTIHPYIASDTISDIPLSDVVFLCVKGYDLDKAVAEVRESIKETTLVIPLLNGANMYERVRAELKTGIVLPGAIYISSAVTEPGTVQHKGGKGFIVLGKGVGEDAVKPQPLLKALGQAEIPFQWYEDPFPAIWSKYIFIAPFSLATAVSGKTLGEVLNDTQLSLDLRKMMEEVEALARAKKVNLPADIVDSTLENAQTFPPETKTSFQRDIEQRKEKDERDIFGGTVLELGRELGVETPIVASYFESLP